MNVPLIDLPAAFAAIRDEVDAAIGRVLGSARFVLGDESAAFETEFARALGVEHAVGVANGTDAVHLALRAAGIGPGDTVAVPALTFFATAEAVVHAGATPLVVDVDERTATIDPHAFAAVVDGCAAVIPVHLYGHPADMDAIGSIAARQDVLVVEDACQAHAARYKGAFCGTLGEAAAFSFYPTKNLGGAGDGGMIATARSDLADHIRRLRHHGQQDAGVHEEIGFNSRLDDLQAAVLRVRLAHLDAYTKARRQIAGWYAEALAGVPLEIPAEAEWAEAVYHLYVVRLDDRDRVAAGLRDRGIGCAVHYPVPLGRQPALRRLGVGSPPAPVADRLAARQLAIPMFPEMQPAHVEAVAAALRELLT